jgi:hypothetical protein
MKRGGAGTVILLILSLLIIVVILFPNQVKQFLSQFNISIGNGTVNLIQSFQQYLNIGNSYQNHSDFYIIFPIFNSNTFNIGASSQSTYVVPVLFVNGLTHFFNSPIVPTNYNTTVYENGNNINFQFSLEYYEGCNNTINSINIQDPELNISIYSFNPNEVSSYYNYFGNSNSIPFNKIYMLYQEIAEISEQYFIIIQNNQYGFSCGPIGVVQLNPTATVSCSININQLESDPQIQSIMNEINSAGNTSLWLGWVKIKALYNCQ